jgi:hypothetical protein
MKRIVNHVIENREYYPKSCYFVLVNEDDNTWECSLCRECCTLRYRTPKSEGMNFCPFCGTFIEGEKIEAFEELIDGIK